MSFINKLFRRKDSASPQVDEKGLRTTLEKSDPNKSVSDKVESMKKKGMTEADAYSKIASFEDNQKSFLEENLGERNDLNYYAFDDGSSLVPNKKGFLTAITNPERAKKLAIQIKMGEKLGIGDYISSNESSAHKIYEEPTSKSEMLDSLKEMDLEVSNQTSHIDLSSEKSLSVKELDEELKSLEVTEKPKAKRTGMSFA